VTLTNASALAINAATPSLSMTDSTWAVAAYFQSGVNTGGTGTGNYFLTNVPTGKGFTWAVNNASKMLLDTNGNLGIGMTPSNILDITQNQNASSTVNILNNSAGAAATSDLKVSNGTSVAVLRQNGATYTTSGAFRADGTLIYSTGAGGISIVTQPAQPIYFGTNNAEVARFGTDGSLLVGTTTNSGAGSITTSGNITSNSGQMIMGCPSSSYGSLGYAAKPAGVNAWTYGVSDYAVWIQYGVSSGRLQTYTAAAGTAGNAITPTSGPYVSNLGTSWTNSSDARLKDQFTALSGVLDKLANIVVGTYVWSGQGQSPAGRSDVGIRAQELHTQFPLLVDKGDDSPTWDSETSKMWGINESKVGIVALQAVKELHAIVQELTTRLEALEAK
jgi:hypothetical protein